MPTTRYRCLPGVICAIVFVTVTACVVVSQDTPPLPSDALRPSEQIFQVIAPHNKLSITELGTRVVELANNIKVVDGHNPEVLSITPLSPNRIRLRGEKYGVTTFTMSDEFDTTYTVEVFVEPDVRELQAQLERLFPNAAIQVTGVKDTVVLRGWMTEPDQIPQIIAVAKTYYKEVHDQLRVGGVSQVQLHVKVMEVQRSKIEQLGINFLTVGTNNYVANTIGSLVPVGATGAPVLPLGGIPNVSAATLATPQMQFGITGNSQTFNGFIEALKNESLLKILAEPVLVATSGRPAIILSGGEFPVLVPSGLGTVTIQWREFGVRMECVPIVLGNGRLRLDLAPEVSEKDFTSAVNIQGFTVPGITVRKVNTQVEMNFGQTLMIGGLISTRKSGTMQKVPFLGELPYIGAAFSRKKYESGETELLILVTPHLAAPLDPDQLPLHGPGDNTVDPTPKEMYASGFLEIPRYGPDCPNLGSRRLDDLNGPGITGPAPNCHPGTRGDPGNFNGPELRQRFGAEPEVPPGPPQLIGPGGSSMTPNASAARAREKARVLPAGQSSKSLQQGQIRQTSVGDDENGRRVTPLGANPFSRRGFESEPVPTVDVHRPVRRPLFSRNKPENAEDNGR